MEQFTVTGMSCAACQRRVEKAVSSVPGVTACSVSLLTNSMGVEGTADAGEIIRAVEQAGYGASRRGENGEEKTEALYDENVLADTESPKRKKRLIASVIFLLLLMYITMGHHMWGWPLPAYLDGNVVGLAVIELVLAAVVMIINGQFFTSGFKSLIHGAPNMDTLVALGSAVSFGWSVVVILQMGHLIATGAPDAEIMELFHDQLYFESAAMIPALITVGKLLESLSKGRTTDALRSLMRLAPKTATVLRDGVETEVSISEVKAGDIFAVKPGASVPVDGIVLEGESAVDEAALTGESVPVDKATGDTVSAATINRSGYLVCQATRVGQDTTLSQIIRMVSEAAATKAPIARIADKVSGIFVPAVIGIALIVIIGWLLAGQSMAFALARGISVLVISCPCALGLATPVAIMVGNGVGARAGILFKTSEALEQAGKVDIVVLDKTGTITEGRPAVTDLLPAENVTEEYLLQQAGHLEERSEHPLARAIVEYLHGTKDAGHAGTPSNHSTPHSGAGQDAAAAIQDAAKIEEFRTFPGNGVSAKVDGRLVVGGSLSYMRKSLSLSEAWVRKGEALAEAGKTPLYFSEDGRLLGIIAVADVIRQDSADAVAQLEAQGIRVVMLTGDHAKTARAIADQAGIRYVVAGVLPEGKEAVVRALQPCGNVAMVGDGINDAPALTRAEIGIAIGAGTDVAIDSADIVLMNSSLSDVPAAIRLSRGTLRNIYQNLFWAFFYNVICIPLAAGLFPWKLNPMIGAAAMSLSSFTVCMNALRLNLLKPRRKDHDRPKKQKADIDSRIEAALSDFMQDEEKTEGAGGEANKEAGKERRSERTNEMTKTVMIKGMMCGHCEATVKKALEALDFVNEAVVSHDAGTAVITVSGDVDEAVIKKTIEDKDYEYCGIE